MADSPSEPRVKRQRVDKVGRFAALEKLKQLKGNKHKYEVEQKVDDIYEIVDEREYAKRAREKYGGDWIEDDGTGYAEDGRDFFEDEDDYISEEEEVNGKQNKSKGKKHEAGKKRTRDDEKSAKGKGSIRNLFSNALPKKGKNTVTTTKDDDILADILGELDENPQVAMATTSSAAKRIIAPVKIINSTTRKQETVAVANEYMSNFKQNVKVPATTRTHMKEKEKVMPSTLKRLKIYQPSVVEEEIESISTKAEEKKEEEILTNHHVVEPMLENAEECKTTATDDNFPIDDIDFSCLQEEENQFEAEKESSPVAKSANMNMDDLLQNWENICQMEEFEEEVVAAATEAESALPEDTLKFWYWEAWEDALKRPGEVFLFGRTADGKSICVHVEQVERVLYLLPRENLLDPITKENTKEKVTAADVYKEFDEDIANDLKLNDFRSRKVTKHFANHPMTINIPTVCDYMEVRYDGHKAAPNLKKKYNSIAHIFGANTSALERFLLERKIKGPCWLTLKHVKFNNAAMSWCKMDVSVAEPKYVILSQETTTAAAAPPPLKVLTLNVCTTLNVKSMKQEICLISMLVHNRFHVDRPAPHPAFNQHQCGLTRPANVNWPFDLTAKFSNFKATRIFKHDNERALLSWFLAQYQQIDADLLVTYDAFDCQLDVLADRIVLLKIPQWSRLGRLRMTQLFGKKALDFFVGRMICDVRHSAEECIRARSYDLQTLCQQILKLKENSRIDLNNEDVMELYENGDGILKLITLIMQDASYILRLMCELNIMPLALQITHICGNTMTRTLQGGRSERNEFLLLHAFTEKNYIVPDKKVRQWRGGATVGASDMEIDKSINNFTQDDEIINATAVTTTQANATQTTTRKKAAYAGGLVLEPIRGLYDKYVLLMDFNSLYPSIIQEYNICFTTINQPINNNSEDLPELPDNLETGILPQQLRRLVESRREVKKLMAASDLSPELRMQYHIRQMALKLTANSMYGCLGFAQSRFFAQHLAALVTHKGREILMNTKALVEKLNYEVVYGDTDSIMVNTNITDYDQVFRIGHSIKQNVNKMYKQLELDIDGVFSCLLLLKKKKYAAVKVWKNSKGELQHEQEHKGLDIVRRDWSQLSVMLGKLVLDEVLSEKSLDEKIDALQAHLEKVRNEVQTGAVPLPLYIITKQLSKAPGEFTAGGAAQAHVQVALRMNRERNRRFKKGDMVDYVICVDGTTNAATQRAYHLDELKDNAKLCIDADYYLAHQLHPVITRMVEVLEGLDASRIAEWLGLDPSKFRAAAQRSYQQRVEDSSGESAIKSALQKYRQCDKFTFVCVSCKAENRVASAFKPAKEAGGAHTSVLTNCVNPDCQTAPYQYVISIRNQLVLAMRQFVQRFYSNWLVCDDPACNHNTRFVTHVTVGNCPVCMLCRNGSLIRQYTERDLYLQLDYFKYMFDLSKHQHKSVPLSAELEVAYNMLRETVEQQLEKSAYNTISLRRLFAPMMPDNETEKLIETTFTD